MSTQLGLTGDNDLDGDFGKVRFESCLDGIGPGPIHSTDLQAQDIGEALPLRTP